MSKHTPGPWTFSRWDQFGEARFYVAQAEGAPYTPNYSDVATLIAETVSSEYVSIQEANARLIAAAPDLLEALQKCTEWMEQLRASGDAGNWQWSDGDEYMQAIAAIAKATGEK